jgi:hypothetical protein
VNPNLTPTPVRSLEPPNAALQFSSKTRLGIDLDNTILNYDPLFLSEASRKGLGLKGDGSLKEILMGLIRLQPQGELEWARIEAELMGPRILDVQPHPSAFEFLIELRNRQIPFFFITHRPRFPEIGMPHDLHMWMGRWLECHHVYDRLGLKNEDVFIETSAENKIHRIRSELCTHYLDRGGDFFSHPNFPPDVHKISILTPTDGSSQESASFKDWQEALQRIHRNDTSLLSPSRIRVAPPEKRKTLVLPDYQKGKDALKGFQAVVKETLKQDVVEAVRWTTQPGNTAYLVTTSDGGKPLLGKWYGFSTSQRDSMVAERGFFSYLEALRIPETLIPPKAVDWNEGHRVAIFPLPEGSLVRLRQFEDPTPFWPVILDFLTSLQQGRQTPEAASLPDARDAAFCLKDHLAILKQKRDQWLDSLGLPGVPAELKDLVFQDLENAYERIAEMVYQARDFRRRLPRPAQILSPSSQAIHYFIRRPDGTPQFLFFENSGWDDPARVIAEICCEPGLRTPPSWLPEAAARLSEMLPLDERHDFLLRLDIVRRCTELRYAYLSLGELYHPGPDHTPPDEKGLEKSLQTIKSRVQKLAQRPLA